jgi:hypothetical protein
MAHGGWRSACALTAAVISGFAADRVAMGQCLDTGVRFVRPVGSDGNTGLCWANAYRTLNKALDDLNNGSATVTEIRLAGFDGTSGGVIYRLSDVGGTPGLDWEYNGSFVVLKAVTIEGGYRGVGANEAESNQRDIVGYETILSGDIDDNDSDSPPVLSDNAFHVLWVKAFETDDPFILDGVTVEAGNASQGAASPQIGGGLLISDHAIEGVTALLRDCVFRDNLAAGAGGAVASRANPDPELEDPRYPVPLEVRRCCFERNRLVDLPPPLPTIFLELRGGGAIASDADVEIIRSSFVDNSVQSAAWGGAVSVRDPCSLLRVVNSVFRDNSADPGEAGDGQGGAIRASCTGGTVEITGTLIVNNESIGGDELSGSIGGGVAVISFDTLLRIENSTIADNDASWYAGGVYADEWVRTDTPYVTVEITNSILTGNTSDLGSTFEQQVSSLDFSGPGAPAGDSLIRYSCVEGIDDAVFTPGNVDVDPEFADPGDDYRLASTSPLINAGLSSLVPDDLADVDDNGITTGEDLPWDLDRRDRSIACVDMGAFERGTCAADPSGDGEVDGGDIAVVLGNWGDPGIADLDCSGAAGGGDIAIILGNWETTCAAPVEGSRCEPSAPMEEMSQSTGSGESEGGSSWLTPEALTELFGFESVEEFTAWLLGLDDETMKEMLEGVFEN